jgi:ribonuclease Z
MNLHFETFSKAMYSTWLFHKDSGTLIDAGENLACYFENRVFAIRNLLVTHHHL